MAKEYIALFEYEDETNAIGVIFPDLPGCFSAGDDFDDAFRNAHEALMLYAEDEPALPEPGTLEEIKANWEDWAIWERQYNFVITKIALYPLKLTTKKFNISLDERLVRRIDRVTKNRSAFIASAIEQALK
jgi:predicted RNase H-like HicB family nuclease